MTSSEQSRGVARSGGVASDQRSVRDVRRLLAAIEAQSDIVISPDESGRGMKLLVLSKTAGRFPFSFGPDSFVAHLNAALATGLTLTL